MGTQPTYEESLAKIASMESKLNVLIAAKKGTDDNDEDDKELEASFKKAQSEMKDEDKEKSAETDNLNKVKDAFKKAQDETDDDKKKEAMKKALEMDEDYKSKKGKKAETEEEPKTEKKDMEAKVAATIMKKIPIMQKILEATKIIDPANLAKVEKELTAATLTEVEAKYAAIKPYIAAVGLESTQTSSIGMPAMVPFQASTALQSDPENIFEAGVDDIDFSKVKTSDIMGMYN